MPKLDHEDTSTDPFEKLAKRKSVIADAIALLRVKDYVDVDFLPDGMLERLEAWYEQHREGIMLADYRLEAYGYRRETGLDMNELQEQLREGFSEPFLELSEIYDEFFPRNGD